MVDEVDLELVYTVDEKPVLLTIRIGDAQIGGSVVKRDGEPVGKPGAVNRLPLGKGTDLVSDSIEIKTLVADVNDDTNETSVTYVLQGALPETIVAKRRVANNGDGVLYRTKISFQTA